MANPNLLPVANPTVPFWHSEEDDFRYTRSTPELPEETDILIIGAGYAGAAVAYWTYKDAKTPPPKILMLEARYIASGATGRNGGHLKPDYYREYSKFEKLYGQEIAASIGNFEYEHLSEIKNVVEDLRIDCDFVLTRACNVHLTDAAVENCYKQYEALKKNKYSKVLSDIQVLEGDNARVTSKVNASPVSLTFTAGQLWPYKFIKGLLKYSLERGLNVQTDTPVLCLQTLTDGTYLVKTPRGTVKAKKVVLATNGYTTAIAPEFNDKIVPVKGTCSHIKVTQKHGYAPYLNDTYGLCRNYSEHEYLINRPDGTVIVGGAKQLYLKDKDSWYNNVDDSTLFKGDVKGWYQSFMQNNFYTWKNTETEVDYLWTGILGYSVDSLPWIGEVPKSKNKFIIAGFNGHGMPRIFLSAKAISHMLLTGDPVEKTDIPIPYMLTEERLKTAQNHILEESGYYQYHSKTKL